MPEGVRPAFTRRLAGIEGLRGIAAASVVAFHVWTNSSSRTLALGWLGTYVLPNLARGVELFFALSGFLLYLPFASALLRGEPRPSFIAYLRNRALRILPAYWCIFLLTALVIQSARVHRPGVLVTSITDPWLLLKNLLLIQNYMPSSAHTGIGPAWSLAVEVVFYLALPLLVLLAIALARGESNRDRRRLVLLAPAVLMAILGLFSDAAGERTHGVAHDLWFASFPAFAHLFSIGMALAVLRVENQDGRLRLPRYWRPVVTIAIIGIAAATVAVQTREGIPGSLDVTLMSIPCGLLLALVVLRREDEPSGLVRILESRAFVFVGLISYSVYLWHAPVIFLLRKHGFTAGGGAAALGLNLAVVSAVTAGLSWVTYRWVEKPALRWKARTHAAEPAIVSPLQTTPAPIR